MRQQTIEDQAKLLGKIMSFRWWFDTIPLKTPTTGDFGWGPVIIAPTCIAVPVQFHACARRWRTTRIVHIATYPRDDPIAPGGLILQQQRWQAHQFALTVIVFRGFNGVQCFL